MWWTSYVDRRPNNLKHELRTQARGLALVSTEAGALQRVVKEEAERYATSRGRSTLHQWVLMSGSYTHVSSSIHFLFVAH